VATHRYRSHFFATTLSEIIFDNLPGGAVPLLGFALSLQRRTFNFLRIAINQLACSLLNFSSRVFLLSLLSGSYHDVSDAQIPQMASPAYLARHGVPETPEDLAAHRCLSYANLGKSVWKLQRGAKTSEVRVASHFSANEATALLWAARTGGGIALQPTYQANMYLHDGSLQVVLPDWKVPDMAIYALYPSRKHLSPAVRALLDFLVQRFETLPW
jgi:hypothetical protein